MSKQIKKERKMFLEDLPKWGKSGHGNEGTINWGKSIGYKIYFIYDDIEGWIEIVDYFSKKSTLLIKYNGNEFNIGLTSFKKCALTEILELVTIKFKIEIGTIFKDEKRDITIIDREYRQEEHVDKQGRQSILNLKWYKYTCNICCWTEGWMNEYDLLKGQGCSCCCQSPTIVVECINDIPTTDPWMVKYFQGGYEEAKKYTKCSTQKIIPICPDCGRLKNNKIIIGDIYKRHNIGCICSDKISYPEKLEFSILEQLNLDFQTQLSKTTFKWCENYRYDFYFELNGEQYILEANGNQHYEDCAWGNKDNVQINDRVKKELALQNGILEKNYIVIDCRKSELEFIKQKILEDEKLNEIFDLSDIDWLKAEEFACSNLIKVACEYKKNNPDMTTFEIGKLMKLCNVTISKYLKKGTELGWCYYNAKEEMIKNAKKSKPTRRKPIEVFKNGINLGIFESLIYVEKYSEKLFGTTLCSSGISKVCKGVLDQYKGYTFKYVEDKIVC